MALAAGKSTETYKDELNLLKTLKGNRKDGKISCEKYFYIL